MRRVANAKPAELVRLALSVQYASAHDALPTRSQLRGWARAALERDAEVTLRMVDEAEGRRLNHQFRHQEYATNVLTFVYGSEPLCGDIVLCAPVVSNEAQAQGIALQAHYAHLVVHGVLHLQGYDHETDDEAGIMERRESEIVTRLGYADPYLLTT